MGDGMEEIRKKIQAVLSANEHDQFQKMIGDMARDAITWRNLLQERLNMDVAESFEALTGVKFPYKSRDIVEWTEDAEKALGGSDE
jgi:hypothetical protein